LDLLSIFLILSQASTGTGLLQMHLRRIVLSAHAGRDVIFDSLWTPLIERIRALGRQ
jgi:hypothetical protein